MTSEQVIVLNDREIAGYSQWDLARDNRLKEIKQQPGDPSPHLALAEIAFRTAHYDVAQENMEAGGQNWLPRAGCDFPPQHCFLARIRRT